MVTICDHLTPLRFSPYRPYVFTEHGVLMLANVLNSTQAIDMSVMIIKVFVRLREMISMHKKLAIKLKELEKKIGTHDEEIKLLFNALKQLMAPPERPKRKIGFY